MAAAFQAECVPEGSVWNSAGRFSASKPTTRVDMPKGRMPPLCVYFCWMLAIHRVRYSTCGARRQIQGFTRVWRARRHGCPQMNRAFSNIPTRQADNFMAVSTVSHWSPCSLISDTHQAVPWSSVTSQSGTYRQCAR